MAIDPAIGAVDPLLDMAAINPNLCVDDLNFHGLLNFLQRGYFLCGKERLQPLSKGQAAPIGLQRLD